MKRNLLLLVLVLIISCTLSVMVAADDSVVFADDLKSFEYGNEEFVRINASGLEVYFDGRQLNALLTREQNKELDDVIILLDEYETLANAEFKYKDGSTLTSVYLEKSYLDEYEALLNGDASACVIYFDLYDSEGIKAATDSLYGERVALKGNRIISYDEFPVYATVNGTGIELIRGVIVYCSDAVYFVDFDDVGVDSWYDFYLSEYEELSAWRITDSKLISSLSEAKSEYDAEYTLGFSLYDGISQKIAAVLLILLFAVAPFVIFVIFFVKSFRATKVYKRIYRTVCIFSALELIVFTIIATIVLM